MILLRWLTFVLGSPTVTFTVLLFWISFFLLMLVFVLQWHKVFYFYFPINSKQNALFHPIAYGYSCADWDGLLRDAPSEDIFKVSASTAASEFCDQVQVGIEHISLIVNIRSDLTQQLVLLA